MLVVCFFLSLVGALVMRAMAAALGMRAHIVFGLGPEWRARPIEIRRAPIWFSTHLARGSNGWRAAIARASAPIAIVLVPFAISACLAKARGYDEPVDGPLEIATVMPLSPAEDAGIEVGDTFLELEGRSIPDIESLLDAMQGHAGQPLHAVVERQGSRRELTIVPELRGGRAIMGISPALHTVHRNVDFARAAESAIVAITVEWSIWADFVMSPSEETLSAPMGMIRAMRGAPDLLDSALFLALAWASYAPLVALFAMIGQVRMALRARRERADPSNA